MRRSSRVLPWLWVALACGCSFSFGGKGEQRASREMESAVQASDRDARESRTLSHLKAVEAALDDYIKAEGRIPAALDVLLPKYLSDIPVVDTGLPNHRENSEVQYYPSSLIRDGAVDGSGLKDTGKWGYVHNDQRVIIFVDCTHLNSRGKSWYTERGVF